MCHALVPLCLFLTGFPPEPADLSAIVLPGESRSSALQSQDFRKYASQGNWDDALTEYNGLLARPFDLAPLSPTYLLQSRWLAHRELPVFPAEMRSRLLDQRQTVARPALEAALRRLDAVALQRIVEEQFGSPAANRAGDALGDLAFDRGDFDAAGCWYRLLVPGERNRLVVPVPPADPARARAKELLSRIFAFKRLGPLASVPSSLRGDLEAFARAYPETAGSLAGRDGNLAETLTAILKDRELESPPSEPSTFGGNAQRFGIQPVEPHLEDRLTHLTRRPTLRWDLERRQAGAGPLLPLGEWPARANLGMSVYPALSRGRLYVADPRYLSAIDLSTGETQELFDALESIPESLTERTFPMPDLYRSSVTAAEGHLLARFGTVALQDSRGNPRSGESLLVCLRHEVDGSVRVVWQVKSSSLNGALFEGAPLVHQGRVYVAATRVQNERTSTAVVCYPLTGRAEPAPLWTREVCETRELGNGQIRRLHHLLTLAGPNVVYASHSGAIVALDAVTGQRVWAHRYRSAPRENRQALPGNEGQLPIHDLAPPMFAEGRIYVAPSDSETLFCLDPLTGASLWQREGIQAVHLLGVYDDRLIFSTPEGLRALDARSGGDRQGWVLPDGGGRLPPLGRGQLVGDVILWPTVRGLVAVSAEEGRPLAPPISPQRVPPGNVLYQDGVLVCTGRTTLTLFVEPARPPKIPRPVPPGQGLAPERRRQAWEQAARTWILLDEPVEAARAWLALLDDPEASRSTLRDDRGRAWPAATLALRELDGLRRGPHGEAVQQAINEQASAENPLVRDNRAMTLNRLQGLPQDQPATRTLWRALLRYGEGSQRAAAVRALEKGRPRLGTSPLPTGWTLGPAVDLDPGERLIPGVSRLLTVAPQATRHRLRLRGGDAVQVVWQLDLAFAPTWARPWEEQILLAGPDGLACVRADGVCLWQVTSTEGFDAFQLAGERLIVRVAQGRLRAVDAYDGAILWEFGLNETGLNLPAPWGRIDERYAASSGRIFLRSWGKRYLLDAESGRLIRQETAPETLGADDLLSLEDRRGLLVAERKTIELIDLTTGSSVWKWTVPAQTTSRLEPNRLLGVGAAVWVQVPVNIGHEIHRLDLRDGKPLSELPRLLRAEPLDLSAGGTFRDTVYLIEGDSLVARSSLDAAVRWRQSLPPGPRNYRLEVIGDEVLVVPAAKWAAGAEFRCLAGRVEWMMIYPPGVGALTSAPVVRFDAVTGKRQRLDVPTGPAQLQVSAHFEVLPYLRPEVAARERNEASDLQLLPAPEGWRLVLGSRCWSVK